MAEYIEREAALKTLEKSLLFCESELETGEYRKGCIAAIQDDIGNIKHLPTADVVEVVRYGKCKCYEKMKSENACFCNRFGGYVTEHDYCSRAEKKEGAR